MSKKKFNRYSIKYMLNEISDANFKKAVGYFPGMYLVYKYEDKKQGEKDDAAVQKRKQASFDAARKKVQDVLEKQLGVNVREEDEVDTSLISGETFAQIELVDGQTEADRRRDARLVQLKLVAAELIDEPIATRRITVDKKYGIIEKIFKSYSKVPGLNTLMFRAFKQVEPEDFEIIGSIKSFTELKNKKAKTSFQKAIYDIAGGKQPAVGKGEILSALFIGGTQGDDAAGTGLSFDVRSPTGETLNNKEITDGAQGATDISKFAIQFNKLLNEKCGPGSQGDWPEFMQLCKYLGLSDNITAKVKTVKGKEVTTKKAKVPNVGIKKIGEVLKLESQPWSGWDATQRENAVKAISWLCHVATTHELMIKASGSIESSKKDYVVLQKNYKYEEVINLKKNKKSLPVSGVSTNRVTYKQGGLYNKWPGDEFKFKKNGGAPVLSQPTESKLYKLSLLEALDLK